MILRIRIFSWRSTLMSISLFVKSAYSILFLVFLDEFVRYMTTFGGWATLPISVLSIADFRLTIYNVMSLDVARLIGYIPRLVDEALAHFGDVNHIFLAQKIKGDCCNQETLVNFEVRSKDLSLTWIYMRSSQDHNQPIVPDWSYCCLYINCDFMIPDLHFNVIVIVIL